MFSEADLYCASRGGCLFLILCKEDTYFLHSSTQAHIYDAARSRCLSLNSVRRMFSYYAPRWMFTPYAPQGEHVYLILSEADLYYVREMNICSSLHELCHVSLPS